MYILLCLALTTAVFLFGYYTGQIRAEQALELCPARKSSRFRVGGLTSPRYNVTEPLTAQLCPINNSKIYDHCKESPYSTENMFLHSTKVNVPQSIFPEIHHPSSPSKRSFVMTQEMEWPKKNPVETQCNQIYLTRAGARSNQPNKCIAVVKVAEGLSSFVHSSHRKGYTALLTDQYRDDYPREDTFIEEIGLLPPLLKNLPKLVDEFQNKMGDPIGIDGSRRAVIVMVANEGVMDLALNFICSAEGAGIDLATIAMFVGTREDVELVENMGAKAIYSPALGSMPSRAAGVYLDATFSRMMWFKTTSVFLAIEAGYDVLFQDVDLVWMKDPIPYLRTLNADISFMDDGARTPRYTPFFVNSGFFFVKNNERSRFFQEKMMKCGASEIGRSHSHQSVLIKHLSESHHLAGLKVLVLDKDLFPSGEAYHDRKKYLKTVIERTFTPYVFHMCWTTNRIDKVIYFKEIGLWYLPEEKQCTSGRDMHSITRSTRGQRGSKDDRSIKNRCCRRDLYWKAKT